jgi:site-specific DNA-methyltransferase (adenine-specific)
VILDPEAAAALDEQSGTLQRRGNKGPSRTETDPVSCYGKFGASDCGIDAGYGDTGGASRFFYCAKSSKSEREAGLEAFADVPPTDVTGRKEGSVGQSHARAGMTGKRGRKNVHPTVKPISLMRYLCRLVTPPGGLVVDPFTGSGTTGCAAHMECFRFLGCEQSAEYAAIANARIAHWSDAA